MGLAGFFVLGLTNQNRGVCRPDSCIEPLGRRIRVQVLSGCRPNPAPRSHGLRNPFLTGRQPEAGHCSSRLPAFHAAPPAMQVKLRSSFRPPCRLLLPPSSVQGLVWLHSPTGIVQGHLSHLRSADYYHNPISGSLLCRARFRFDWLARRWGFWGRT